MNSIESAITDFLVNKKELDINYNTFESLNKIGRFILILDGFDEMPWPVNENNVIKAFKEIDKLVEQKSKIILTCRTHFFKCTQDIHEFYRGSVLYDSIKDKYGYKLLFIQPFEEYQVYEYLDKWTNGHSNEYKYKIKNVYNLSDLATRPVLLNIIAKTIPQLDLISESEINSSSLYRMYINFWLKRDDWRSKLSSEERKILAELVSEHMFLHQLRSIHYSIIPELLSESSFGNKKYDLDVLDYELRTCNFLKNDQIGNYSFVHTSFMEYLLAELMFNKLFDQENVLDLDWYIPLEVVNDKNRKIASPEVEFFFLQLFELKLKEINPQAIVSIAANDYRKQNIIAITIIKLENYNYGEYYIQLINKPSCRVDENILAYMILKSNDLHKIFSELFELLKDNPDINHIQKVYDIIQHHGNKDHQVKIYIEQINEIIKQREKAYDEKQIIEKVQNSDYPYEKAKRREKLDQILAELTESEEILEEKKRFYRNWEREKAEYDQKIRQQERIESELEKKR